MVVVIRSKIVDGQNQRSLRENLRQKDIEQKYSDWTYEFQRLNKSIKSANEHIQELTLRKKKS